MKLQPSPKLACGRSVPLEETIDRLEALIGKQHEYVLYEEQVSEHLFWSALFIDALEFRSMGKGTSARQSKAGALAEAAEWLACRETVDLPGYVCKHQDELEPGRMVPIEAHLEHISTATPPVLEEIKDLPDAYHWVEAWSLSRDEPVLVPVEYASLISGPNGQAAGNTREEAIEHALLEIFERRVHITVMRNRLVLPTIDPLTIPDPLLQAQWAFIQSKGIEVILKDLSFEGALPCVGAYFVDPAVPDHFQFHHFFKVGSAFNQREALMRTFTEFTQGRLQREFLRDGRVTCEELLQPDFRGLWAAPDPCENFLSAFMFGFLPCRDGSFLREGPVVPFRDEAGYRDSKDDILAGLAICRSLGKDVLVVDRSTPGSGFHVMQVIVPSYSDVLPFHPPSSPALFRRITRPEVLHAPEYQARG